MDFKFPQKIKILWEIIQILFMYSLSAIKFLVWEKHLKQNSIWSYAEIISHCEAILVFSIDTKNKHFVMGHPRTVQAKFAVKIVLKGQDI